MIAGESQPPAVHAIAHAINEALGAVGTTVSYTAPAEAAPGGETAALAALVGEMQPGRGRDARRPRLEPGLRGARRPEDRRGARQGAVPDPPRALPRRDGRALPLAPAGLAPARELGRPARGRRDGLDRPAADRAALPHALRDRGPGRLRARASRRATTIVRAHWQARARRGRLREALEPGAPRRRRGRHRLRGEGGEGRRPARGRRRGGEGAGRAGSRSPSAPIRRLRRALREPRLAAGAAEAAHQDHLGQRGARQPEDGGRARRRARPSRPRAATSPRSPSSRSAAARVEGAALGAARPRRRRRDRAPRLRPHARGPGRHRRRLRRLRAAHERRAVGGAAGSQVRKTGETARIACTQDHWTIEATAHAAGAGAAHRAGRDPRRAREGPARGPEAGPRAASPASRCTRRTSTRATPGAWRST